MKHSTEYLYGIKPFGFSSMQYKEALEFRVANAKLLLARLLAPHYTERDDERINAVFKAIKFNESLLKELQ